MNKALLGMGLAVGLAVSLGAQVAEAREMAGFRVEAGTGATGAGINEGQRYNLFNLDQKQYLGYKDRRGANLGWDASRNNGMMVKRKTAGSGPIKCGEVFGLFIEKEWLIHEKQMAGINISTRTKLDKQEWYQWKFTNCTAGEVIQLNQPVTLTNTVANDSLVGCTRVWGINVGWAETVGTIAGRNYHKDAMPRR